MLQLQDFRGNAALPEYLFFLRSGRRARAGDANLRDQAILERVVDEHRHADRFALLQGGDDEVRRVFETSDFPADVLSPEVAAKEEALRAKLAQQ